MAGRSRRCTLDPTFDLGLDIAGVSIDRATVRAALVYSGFYFFFHRVEVDSSVSKIVALVGENRA